MVSSEDFGGKKKENISSSLYVEKKNIWENV